LLLHNQIYSFFFLFILLSWLKLMKNKENLIISN
jgi:hypothetical protein